MTASVTAYKNKPALLGWSVADDADNGRFSISELTHRDDLIKSNDSKHDTFFTLTAYYPDRRQNAGLYSDIANIGLQIYPITPLSDYDETPENALSQTYERTLQYVKAADQDKKSMIMHPKPSNLVKTAAFVTQQHWN